MSNVVNIGIKTNSRSEVEHREKTMTFQDIMIEGILNGSLTDDKKSFKVDHVFSPVYEQYGCALYARTLSMPKGRVAVGKISKIPFINILVKGTLLMATEDGPKTIVAPKVFVSPAGTKRAGYVVEDAIWVTVKPTTGECEDDLELVENECTANSFDELGLIGSVGELNKLKEN